MFQIRKSSERGLADHGWLKSRHSFSFADYYDPDHMGFRSLRVINEDRIAGGTGFGSHPHRDMEIISYVVQGALEHKDSMGTRALIKPGEIQRMSAGTGVVHSEYNASSEEEAHFFQIWILPSETGGEPGYGQKSFEEDLNSRSLVLVASPDGREGSISIRQDALLYLSRLKEGQSIEYPLSPQRGAWLQVIRGQLKINGKDIFTGDAISLEEESLINIMASAPSELMLFDLA